MSINQYFDTDPKISGIHKKTIKYKNGEYQLYTMDDNLSEYPEFGAYRSAIVSNGKLVCLAPTKSLSRGSFQPYVNTTLSGNDGNSYLTQIVEGTMINLFWDEANNSWEIASRRNIGCNCWYFKRTDGGKPMTFREMFFEALGITSLENLEDNVGLEFFNKSCCYSFVLQHPENHLVMKINKPAAYLTYIYRITHEDGKSFFRHLRTDRRFGIGRIMYPEDEESLSAASAAGPVNLSSFVGTMMINEETGARWTLYNDVYLEYKALRGNNPSLYYQYLTLRKIHKVADFLTHFPQYADEFQRFTEHFGKYKARIHQLYMDVHVLKTRKLSEVPSGRDKYFVEKLHYEVYLPGLKAEGKGFRVTRNRVEEFLDSENIVVPFGTNT
jgi:hypothetical protein